MVIYGKDLPGISGRIDGANVWATRDGCVYDLENKVIYDPKAKIENFAGRPRINFLMGDDPASMEINHLVMFSFLGRRPVKVNRTGFVSQWTIDDEVFVVKYLNGNQDDNRIDNLVLVSSEANAPEDFLFPTIAVNGALLIGLVQFNQTMEKKLKEKNLQLKPFDLYESNRDSIKAVIGKATGGKYSDEVLEDLVSDAFLRAHTMFHTFDPEKAKLTTWLYTVAINVAIQYARKDSKMNTMSVDKHTGLATIVERSFTTVADEMESTKIEDMKAKLKVLEDILSPENWQIIQYRMEEKTYQEIADIMGFNLNTIKIRIRRIMLKAQSLLDEENRKSGGKIRKKRRHKSKYDDPRMPEIVQRVISLRKKNLMSTVAIREVIIKEYGVTLSHPKINSIIYHDKLK